VHPALVLASGSPQRRTILQQLGVRFSVRAAGAAELEAGEARQVAVENARRKALAVAAAPDLLAPALVLGVDTVVSLGGRILGKPVDALQARAHLEALAGREHQVVSGMAAVAVARAGEAGETRIASARTAVRFRPLGAEALGWYVGTEEWRGRAGGYAIQGRGAALVREIRGDYLNVVGLPVSALLDLVPDLMPGLGPPATGG
jgi:septum formation protein